MGDRRKLLFIPSGGRSVPDHQKSNNNILIYISFNDEILE